MVGLVALTGLTLAVIQLQSFRALLDTSYGIILLVKLALVIVLLGFAALNRFVVTPALAENPGDTHPLFGSVLVELVLVIAILAAVAGWRFTPPPRALAASAQPPLAIHIHTDAAMFQVLISPGKVGTDNFVLQLMNGDASPFEAKEVTLTLSLPERGVEPLERKADPRPRRLLARPRRDTAACRPLAHADRGAGHGFPESHAGRRFRTALKYSPTGSHRAFNSRSKLRETGRFGRFRLALPLCFRTRSGFTAFPPTFHH